MVSAADVIDGVDRAPADEAAAVCRDVLAGQAFEVGEQLHLSQAGWDVQGALHPVLGADSGEEIVDRPRADGREHVLDVLVCQLSVVHRIESKKQRVLGFKGKRMDSVVGGVNSWPIERCSLPHFFLVPKAFPL